MPTPWPQPRPLITNTGEPGSAFGAEGRAAPEEAPTRTTVTTSAARNVERAMSQCFFGCGGRCPERRPQAELRLSHRSEDGAPLYRNFRKAQQSQGFPRPRSGYESSRLSMSSANDVLPPRYLRPARIGYGGMGEIFRAEDEVLGRTVAIKVLSQQYARDESLRARFTREALAAARLSGEAGAVTIFDVGEWDGRPFIVMEYLGGGSLDARLRTGGPPSQDEALAWLGQAA